MDRLAPDVRPTSQRSWRGWELFAAPRPLLAFMLTAEFVAVAGYCWAASSLTVDYAAVTAGMLLLVLSLGYEAGSRRIESLQFRFGGGVHTDMSSVWAIAAGLALAPGYAVGVVVGVRACMWFVNMRRIGAKPYRQVFTASTNVLGCLAVGAVLGRLGLHPGLMPGGLHAALAILLAICVYILINRCLVASAICIANRSISWSTFTLDWEDNALEVATLCLGGAAAVLIMGYPWLVMLVLVPMFVLQRSTMVKQFREAAMTDAKTGLLNAVAWEQLAQRELLRADRDHVGAALLLIDLDHFKDVNDTHGHLAGDVVLKAVADTLRRELRDYDALGRFGGEEFVALLPGADASEGMLAAERLRVAISRIALPEHAPEKGAAMLTSSIGLACYPQHGIEIEDLLHAADTAMYAAKRAGRNRALTSNINTKDHATLGNA